jgi:hypothetical protein
MDGTSWINRIVGKDGGGRMNLMALGFDPVKGTVGALRLGDIVGPDRSSRETRPLRKCAYVIVGDDGKVVGRCGTVLREGNRGCFCAMHTEMKVKGARYVASLEARKRRRLLHLVRT